MKQADYYEFERTYDYEEEVPIDGAVAAGIEGAEILYGSVTWSASVVWDDLKNCYEVDMTWTDHSRNFSSIGEGPKEEQFWDDLYEHLESQGVSYGALEGEF